MISSISDNFQNIFGRDSGMNGVRISRDGDNISIKFTYYSVLWLQHSSVIYEIQSDQKCNRSTYRD